jgi:hypothetical protein
LRIYFYFFLSIRLGTDFEELLAVVGARQHQKGARGAQEVQGARKRMCLISIRTTMGYYLVLAR